MSHPLVRVAAVAVALALSACAEEPESALASPPTTAGPTIDRALISPSSAATSTTVAPTTTTTTIAPRLEHDGVARALVTSTGIVVPVIETTVDGWAIRTPCGALALALEGTTIDGVHVVLDPGHGGADEPGAVVDDITEAELNLEVARRAAAALNDRGVVTLLTREGDYRLPIVTRVEIADRLGADLLVSVHHQGGGDLPIGPDPGTEVYHQQGSVESARLAGILHATAVESLGAFGDAWFNGPDAGATYRPNADTGEDFYGMVRRPTMPAVLAELSFMGNPAELDLLRTDEFLDAEAAAIVEAVVRWYTTDDVGSGVIEPSFGLRSSGGGGGLAGCSDPDLGPLGELPAGVGEDGDSG